MRIIRRWRYLDHRRSLMRRLLRVVHRLLKPLDLHAQVQKLWSPMWLLLRYWQRCYSRRDRWRRWSEKRLEPLVVEWDRQADRVAYAIIWPEDGRDHRGSKRYTGGRLGSHCWTTGWRSRESYTQLRLPSEGSAWDRGVDVDLALFRRLILLSKDLAQFVLCNLFELRVV